MTASPRPTLPPAREPGRYRVAFVCLGNICRSPTADVVMQGLVEQAGLSGPVAVRSSGTAGWHIGKRMDERSAATLTARGYDPTRHRAQQFDGSWLADDLVLAMDAANLADLREVAGTDAQELVDTGRLRLFRDFDPQHPGADCPDPYYGGQRGFEEVLDMVEETCATLLHEIQEQGVLGGHR